MTAPTEAGAGVARGEGAALTLERLRELLSYDPETGIFRWLVNSGRVRAGAVAGGNDSDGYVQITIDYRKHLAHRLAWLYLHGEWPIEEIDHRNGVRSNNWIGNLRKATSAQNHENLTLLPSNTSGRTGATWNRRSNKWVANIRVNGVKKHLGYFNSVDEAGDAYVAAKAEQHTFQPAMREPQP